MVPGVARGIMRRCGETAIGQRLSPVWRLPFEVLAMAGTTVFCVEGFAHCNKFGVLWVGTGAGLTGLIENKKSDDDQKGDAYDHDVGA